MKPDRELDALIAERVMGLVVERGPSGAPYVMPFVFTPKPYSTDIAAAWEVVSRLTLEKYTKCFTLQSEIRGGSPAWFVWFRKDQCDQDIDGCSAEGDTPAHAICLAALKAVGA